MKHLLLALVLLFTLGCGPQPKYQKGQYVYLNGAQVRIIGVDTLCINGPRYQIRHCGFSSTPDTGILANGQKVNYAGTSWIREWELDERP